MPLLNFFSFFFLLNLSNLNNLDGPYGCGAHRRSTNVDPFPGPDEPFY